MTTEEAGTEYGRVNHSLSAWMAVCFLCPRQVAPLDPERDNRSKQLPPDINGREWVKDYLSRIGATKRDASRTEIARHAWEILKLRAGGKCEVEL